MVSVNLNDIAWKTGIMDFHDTPLSEVTEVLINTYHRKIELDPASWKLSVLLFVSKTGNWMQCLMFCGQHSI